jgi:UTP--glucose-1-phosphate uridylyltransferase
MVEKPKLQDAPSRLAVAGRYILTPAVFDRIRAGGKGAQGEIQLTDGIAGLIGPEKVYAYTYEGKRYDCGSKQGFLQATVELALQHHEVADEFGAYLRQLNF